MQRAIYLPPFGPFGDPRVLVALDESGDFSRFGEETRLEVRSSMLEEGLQIMRDMWAGSTRVGGGHHYAVDLPSAPAEPHPIPIWMASSARHPRVVERATRCDGIFPISDHTFRPDELAPIVEQVRAGVGPDRSFDVVVSGNASPAWDRPNPDDVDLGGMAEAGATWWMESLMHFDPLELSLQVVDAGPP